MTVLFDWLVSKQVSRTRLNICIYENKMGDRDRRQIWMEDGDIYIQSAAYHPSSLG